MTRILAAIALAIAPLALAHAAESDAPQATPDASPTPASSIDPRLLGPALPHDAVGGAFLGGLPAPAPHAQAPVHLSRGRVASMIAVPAGCLMAGGTVWAGMANQTGDAGTPAAEIGAGYAGAWTATALFAAGVFVVDHDALKPAALRQLSESPWTIAVTGTLVPLAAGGAAAGSGELLEGGSRRPWEAFAGAVGGAAAGELLTIGASRALHTPDASTVEALIYVPVAAGAALGYRAARGSFGRDKALIHAPLVVVSARF